MKQFSETHLGVFYALGAYLIWGISPLYFKHIDVLPVFEIISHRVIWSVLFLAIILTVIGQWPRFIKLLKSPKLMGLLCLSTALISTNWLVFIWSINNDHMLDASLGYFINPLVNVLLGLIFLNESLSRIKWFALFLAFCGVGVQVVELGSLPWISLVLPFSFAFYGLVRKKIKVEALVGLFVETLIALPIALIYLCYFANSTTSNLFHNPLTLNLWIVSAGAVTAMPLIFFAQAALRLRLSTLGFFQYIAPSLMFLFAVVFYNEPIGIAKSVTFGFIWAGVLVFIFENKIKAFIK